MLKRIPISIIIIIFIYQICIYLKYRNVIIPEVDINVNTEKKQQTCNVNNKNLKLENKESENKEPENKKPQNKEKKIKFNYDNNLSTANIFENFEYGEPHLTKMSKDGPIYMWKFNNPVPWSKILHLPGNDYSYEFSFKIEVPSINHYNLWKKIIPNLNFNPDTGEIIIPANDEEGALSVANLMINNFKNKIKIEDVLKKNLINISIIKAKNYPIVKKKIKEQIIEMLTKKDTSFKREADYEEDLAKAKVQQETQENFGPSGYGGSGYSYL